MRTDKVCIHFRFFAVSSSASGAVWRAPSMSCSGRYPTLSSSERVDILKSTKFCFLRNRWLRCLLIYLVGLPLLQRMQRWAGLPHIGFRASPYWWHSKWNNIEYSSVKFSRISRIQQHVQVLKEYLPTVNNVLIIRVTSEVQYSHIHAKLSPVLSDIIQMYIFISPNFFIIYVTMRQRIIRGIGTQKEAVKCV